MMTLIDWLRGNDVITLALTLWGEARGEPIEGRIAVGCVIMNRARLHYRGGSVAAVCLYPRQFSCWGPLGGEQNNAHLTAIAQAMCDGVPPPWTPYESSIYDECLWIAEGLVRGRIRDRVMGCMHYLTRELYDTQPPLWAVDKPVTCQVGSQVFLRGIR